MGGSGQGRLRLGLRPGGGFGGSPDFGGIAIMLAAQVRAFVSETLYRVGVWVGIWAKQSLPLGRYWTTGAKTGVLYQSTRLEK
jgi:hypothetical protein